MSGGNFSTTSCSASLQSDKSDLHYSVKRILFLIICIAIDNLVLIYIYAGNCSFRRAPHWSLSPPIVQGSMTYFDKIWHSSIIVLIKKLVVVCTDVETGHVDTEQRGIVQYTEHI